MPVADIIGEQTGKYSFDESTEEVVGKEIGLSQGVDDGCTCVAVTDLDPNFDEFMVRQR